MFALNFGVDFTYLASFFSADLSYFALNLAEILHKLNAFNANPTYFALNFGVDFTYLASIFNVDLS